ncbi:MAG: methyltransferase domain-containing protein [Deltaproteobacteria bacterium]|nr:methyltransferase domain-containing protein [Deltaproteobacteria bacterium]
MRVKGAVKALLRTGREVDNTARQREASLAMNRVISGGAVEAAVVPGNMCDMPQAIVAETSLQAFEDRDWRQYFSTRLHGRGLEIGPLHRPMVRHDGMDVDYIDRLTVEELRRHYPELKELPLVEPNIIGDAQYLSEISNDAYDFLISAHVIEHVLNPILALKEWCRVIKPGGLIYLIVPDKRVIFDKKRVRTTLEHLILDFLEPSKERDFEHYLEYALFVHNKIGADAIEEARRLIATDYSIHYHVFIPSDIVSLLNWFSTCVSKIKILEGPVMAPGSDEFHFLLSKF